MIVLALVACGGPASPDAYERPVVVASARELDFGWVAEGDVATQELVLTNDGELPFGIDKWTLQDALGAGFTVSGPAPGALVEPGAEAVFTVSFAPEAARCEGVLSIGFFEDEETAWLDREYPWLPVRLGGSGIGMPVAEEPIPFVIGTAFPDRTGAEVGETITFDVRAGEPLTYMWSARDGEGVLISDGGQAEWTLPDEIPAGYDDGAVYRLSLIARDDDGNQFWDFVEVMGWGEGKLREPVVLGSE